MFTWAVSHGGKPLKNSALVTPGYVPSFASGWIYIIEEFTCDWVHNKISIFTVMVACDDASLAGSVMKVPGH